MDSISFKILEDGTITMKTSLISPGNHMSADKLLADMETLMGGTVIKEQNPDAKGKAHVHSHESAHAEHGHSHDGGVSFHHH
jgi:hypothetical protein